LVPRVSRTACFHRSDRGWVPDEAIAEQVVLASPDRPVDLVTVRGEEATLDDRIEQATQGLRSGGRLLLVLEGSLGIEVPFGFDEVAETESGRLYRKSRGVTTRGCARPIRPRRADDEEPDTLEALRRQEELVESHVRLARSLARRFAHHGEPADDLEQVAMLALVKAAKRFDADRNTRFATYATSSILGELKRHFRDKDWMLRVPRSIQERYLAVKQARDELSHQVEAAPTPADIARHLELSEEAVLEAIEAGDNFWPASLDRQASEDGGPTEIPVVDEGFNHLLDRIQVQRLMPTLEHRERLILRRIFFDGRTQSDVAEEIGLSQMQISRLLAQTLTKLQG
jgi:RNA polymerase sigma-B factor